jgi:hypothetical protein
MLIHIGIGFFSTVFIFLPVYFISNIDIVPKLLGKSQKESFIPSVYSYSKVKSFHNLRHIYIPVGEQIIG